MTLPENLRARLPNWISAARLLLTPGLVWWVWVDRPRAFLLFGLALMASDAVDGNLARIWGVTSDFGRKLDGWSDTLFHITFFSLTLYLLADDVRQHLWLCLLPLVFFGLIFAAGYLLTGRVRQIHLLSKKVTSYLFIIWVSVSLWTRFNLTWLWLVNLSALLACLEEVSLYMVQRRQVDERLVSIWQLRRH